MSGASPRDYLDGLALRATRGLGSLAESFRSKQARRILASRRPDGGFAGRGETSDLYYTSFALRCAELLGMDDPALWQGAAGYVRERVGPPKDIVDCFSMLHTMHLVKSRLGTNRPAELSETRQDDISSVLRRCATAQGGVAIAPGGAPAVYHTFLAMLCHHLLGRSLPDARRAVGFVFSCMRDDGGFANQDDAAPQAGTNPTAAAVALLVMHDALKDAAAERVADFIASMQRDDGGFAAHASAPVSDTMSTFTALVTLAELGALRRVRPAAAARYVRGLAGADDVIDPEYTYYGLGALGILGAMVAPAAVSAGQPDGVER